MAKLTPYEDLPDFLKADRNRMILDGLVQDCIAHVEATGNRLMAERLEYLLTICSDSTRKAAEDQRRVCRQQAIQ